MKYTDLAIEENGNMLVLVTTTGAEPSFALRRCSSSGEPLETITITNLPAELMSGFIPSSLYCQAGMICVVDREVGLIAIIDVRGEFIEVRAFEGRWDAASYNNGAAVVTSSPRHSVRPSFLNRLLNRFLKFTELITKPSSSRNTNDTVKSPFSRNGLLINGVGNNFAKQD